MINLFRIDMFWTKHFDIISKSSYSTIMYDIYKGIGALYDLIRFVTDNINGGELEISFIERFQKHFKLILLFYFKVKINNIFANYNPVITNYLESTFSIAKEDAIKIGDSYVFSNPQKLYDIYVNSKNINISTTYRKACLTRIY